MDLLVRGGVDKSEEAEYRFQLTKTSHWGVFVVSQAVLNRHDGIETLEENIIRFACRCFLYFFGLLAKPLIGSFQSLSPERKNKLVHSLDRLLKNWSLWKLLLRFPSGKGGGRNVFRVRGLTKLCFDQCRLLAGDLRRRNFRWFFGGRCGDWELKLAATGGGWFFETFLFVCPLIGLHT